MARQRVLGNGRLCHGGGGKVCYSRGDSLKAVQELLVIDTDPDNQQKVAAYKCLSCHRWHIGHSRYR